MMGKFKLIFGILLMILGIWIGITSGIQRFKCDTLTETQLFKKIPENFILKFQQCD